MRRLWFLLLVAIPCISPAFVRADGNPASWPRFRGPNGTGVAADADIPVRWSEKKNLLWKVAIPGQGNSSPIVWGERLFLQTATADGKDRLLLCLDSRTGATLWSREIPGSKAHMHPKNSLASATPATDGERVYVPLWDGAKVDLHAYDFRGESVWTYPLGSFTSQHGPGTSPIVYGGKVFIANDQDGTANFVALDAKSGKLVWEAPRRAYRACYSTPFLLERPETPVELIVASTGGITSYDPQSGHENWNYHWTFDGMPLRTVASPLYASGLIIANSGDGGGARQTVAVRVGGKGDISRTHLAWEKKKAFPYVPTMLVYGDHLFLVNDNGVAACHAVRTGDVVWSERLGGNVTASSILIDGKIYTISEDGTVYVYRAAPTFELLAKNSVGEDVFATPAVANQRLYIRGKTHLFCIGQPSEGQRSAR